MVLIMFSVRILMRQSPTISRTGKPSQTDMHVQIMLNSATSQRIYRRLLHGQARTCRIVKEDSLYGHLMCTGIPIISTPTVQRAHTSCISAQLLHLNTAVCIRGWIVSVFLIIPSTAMNFPIYSLFKV